MLFWQLDGVPAAVLRLICAFRNASYGWVSLCEPSRAIGWPYDRSNQSQINIQIQISDFETISVLPVSNLLVTKLPVNQVFEQNNVFQSSQICTEPQETGGELQDFGWSTPGCH